MIDKLGAAYVDVGNGYSVRFPEGWAIRTFHADPWVLDCGDAASGIISIGFTPCPADVTADRLLPEAIARRIRKTPGTTLLGQGRTLLGGHKALWFKSTGPLLMTNGSPTMTRVQYIVPLGDGRLMQLRLAAPPQMFASLSSTMKQTIDTFTIIPRPGIPPRRSSTTYKCRGRTTICSTLARSGRSIPSITHAETSSAASMRPRLGRRRLGTLVEQRRVDLAGKHRARPNAGVAFFGIDRRRQSGESELRCRIRRPRHLVRPQPRIGDDIDDCPAAGLSHRGQEGVDALKCADQVGVDQFSEVFDRQIRQRPSGDVHARGVHQYGRIAEILAHPLGHRDDLLLIRNITRDRQQRLRRHFGEFDRLVEHSCRAEQGHAVAALGQIKDNRAPDAAARSCHHRNLAHARIVMDSSGQIERHPCIVRPAKMTDQPAEKVDRPDEESTKT